MTGDGLIKVIEERAVGASDPLPCHWIHGANDLRIDVPLTEGDNFCPRCAGAVVAWLKGLYPDEADYVGLCVDGGWLTDHDAPPYCEACGAKLEGCLTDCGVEEELDHFSTHPPTTPECWDALLRAAGSMGMGDESWSRLERIVGIEVHT
jgi:hypothetical protein